MKRVSTKIEGTEHLAQGLVKEICKLKHKQACLPNRQAVVVALTGELGSGKTTFIQFFAKALGVRQRITSPTFVILKCFKLRAPGFRNLIHIDAYRIENFKELLDLGWEEMIKDSKNIILVEWAEKIRKILPKKSIWLKFGHKSENSRTIDGPF